MNIIEIDEQIVQGISVRTKNSAEINSETAKIGGLWGQFGKAFFQHMTPESQVYGVYFNYESDATGEFDMLAGMGDLSDAAKEANAKELETVTIKAGRYLVFSGTGKMPDKVIELWQNIWQYFNGPDCLHQRTYETDFEHYTSRDSVDIHIGIA